MNKLEIKIKYKALRANPSIFYAIIQTEKPIFHDEQGDICYDQKRCTDPSKTHVNTAIFYSSSRKNLHGTVNAWLMVIRMEDSEEFQQRSAEIRKKYGLE